MKDTTKNFMYKISSQASLILLILAICTFIALTIFKFDYWHNSFLIKFNDMEAKIMAVFVASIAEAIRFGLLISSSKDIADKNTIGWVLGILASIGMLFYEVFYMAYHVGEYWSRQTTTFTNLFIFLAIMGFILELRLCLLMRGQEPEQKETNQIEIDSILDRNLLQKILKDEKKHNGTANGVISQ